MDLWLVILFYIAGVGLMVLEATMPGIILGLVGLGLTVVAVVFGFQHSWLIGSGQILLAVVVIPMAFVYMSRRMALKVELSAESGAVGFAKDYSVYLGKEGETITDLHPSGMVRIDGKKVDVVTAGEMIDEGKHVRVVKVEGNRVIVRKI
ncbi:MAG: NfeD family protein [Planctomycetota bacterium]|jgi:membrane-bound serine protease (ClpP class)